MEQVYEKHVKRLVNNFAVLVVFFMIVLIPSSLLYISYNHLSYNLQLKADIIAEDASVYFYQYPDSWMYQEERLQSLIQKHISLDIERSMILSSQNELQMSIGNVKDEPLLTRVAPVSDGEDHVATISVQTSLQPLIYDAYIYFLISSVLGLALITGLYIWPYKSLKQNLRKLNDTRSALEEEMSLKKEIMIELEKERDFTNTIIESAGNVIVVLDADGRFVRFNKTAEKLTGFNSENVFGKYIWDVIIPEKFQTSIKSLLQRLLSGDIEITSNYECEWKTHDNKILPLSCISTLLKGHSEKPDYIVIMGIDIRDRIEADKHKERLQRELNQARKMEALGQLTGGIAHDFNNMLGIISGYSDLAREKSAELKEPELNKYLENILQATQRASGLVRQMMVFSRKDPGENRVLDIQKVVSESINMLRSVIPSSIIMDYQSEADIPRVYIDEVQLQQVIMNLCLNAKDAMQGIGEIKVELSWRSMQGEECSICHKFVTGQWVQLTVSDTGQGITQDIIDHIFEPFFTTKEVGQGTGMGLSMVHSIVENHGGHIMIDSRVNQGTTFRILLPAAAENVLNLPESNKDNLTGNMTGSGEKIMVVDDEPGLAAFIGDMLVNNGYTCDVKTDSHQALEAFIASPNEYDMLITDQTMPGLTGVDIIDRVREIRPDIQVILCTGYSEKVDRHKAESMGVLYINKPFTAESLLSSVYRLLKDSDIT